MKRFLLFIMLFLVSQSAFGQLNVWRWQNPSVQGNTLNAVKMVSMKKTFACGDRGTVIQTSDGGLTWDVKYQLLGNVFNFYGLDFLYSSYGMICGDSGIILKTTDAGNSWKELTTITHAALRGIVILDTNLAIAVGLGGMILQTTDGGVSWQRVPFENAIEFTSIRKLRPDFITITGHQGLLYKSIDTGTNWQQIIIKTDTITIGNDINGQVFYNDTTAIVVGDLGGIFATSDGGKTWTNHSVEPIYAATLNAIDGKDPNGSMYAAVGDYAAIFHSTDGGNAWSRVNLGITDSLQSISFFDRLNAMAVGRYGIIINTTDGGASWTFLPSKPVTHQLNSIAFPKGDTSLGVAVGRYGDIMLTTNGGAHWDLIPSSITSDLTSVAFLSPTELCAVGLKGIIIRSNDGGLHWNTLVSGTTKNFNSVSFPTFNFGWAVGDSGIVVFTRDGGTSWAIYPFSKKRSFNGISFSDSLHGYMSSDHGVYITTDGGVTWADPDDITYYLNCSGISTPSANVVSFTYGPCDYAGSGGIMTSHDGGKNWFNGQVNGGLLYGISFPDDLHGTVVGVGGYIAHTSDGGMNWIQQDSHTLDKLLGVSFGTKKAGTAVGLHGTILRITTDE